jgi:DNA protecting protein DprA
MSLSELSNEARQTKACDQSVTSQQVSAMFWSLQSSLTARERATIINLLERKRIGDLFDHPTADDAIWEELSRKALRRNQDHLAPDPSEVITILEWTTQYGKRLTPGAPLALHVQRQTPRFRQPSVAIIGSRHPTFAARRSAYSIAHSLARKGCFIWSGAAIGTDTVALYGALEGGRKTHTHHPDSIAAGAVLGGGLNVLYPPSNKMLFADHRLALLSESAPNVRAQPWHFPKRNFVIAWLADYVLVIEAKRNSGSLITAQEAAGLGKGVGALVWPENHTSAAGNSELLELGADPIESEDDVLRALAAAHL